jgi:hypothetical protein
MLDVHFPTTEGRTLVFTRYTQPEKDQQLLLHQLKFCLPHAGHKRSALSPSALRERGKSRDSRKNVVL